MDVWEKIYLDNPLQNMVQYPRQYEADRRERGPETNS